MHAGPILAAALLLADGPAAPPADHGAAATAEGTKPEGVAAAVVEQRARKARDTWWSWRPLSDAALPEVADASWVRTPVDRFILAKLEAAGIRPAPEASRAALIRRATLDLTGLPPTPEDVAAFEADTRPDAYERLIDRLLESPEHGVHWARHWLDLVRYADTNGFERDSDKVSAWKYRDWVVQAINDDMPYDRFVLEQLAGDELPDRT
ncbi:MAG: DUF1549 domain-containing protein, partial [Phycisphaerales bacterium]